MTLEILPFLTWRADYKLAPAQRGFGLASCLIPAGLMSFSPRRFYVALAGQPTYCAGETFH